MAARLDIVLERIRALLAATEGGRPSRDRIERTLTEGYAEALALDGERLRLERRIDEVTARLAAGEKTRPNELRTLTVRIATVENDLADLRELLSTLRSRATRAA
jgi:predicted  nucleic acid-binding Zn-ribbon protein